MSTYPSLAAELHRPTLLKVLSTIERRIADLDRRGPPNAPGHACNSCKDTELHRLLGILRELAAGTPPDPTSPQRRQRPASTKEK